MIHLMINSFAYLINDVFSETKPSFFFLLNFILIGFFNPRKTHFYKIIVKLLLFKIQRILKSFELKSLLKKNNRRAYCIRFFFNLLFLGLSFISVQIKDLTVLIT